MRSLPPFLRVLAWAVEQGMSVRDQLSEEQLIALERAFSGQVPWSFEHYPSLSAFAHALPRLQVPDLPALLNFGDALQALDEHRAGAVAAWQTHPAVEQGTFAELRYGATSAAITRIRDHHAAAWREHGAHNRELLLRGAEHAGGQRAVVIGAGKLYDIPLRKLAERFEQLILVDIDAAAMAESVKQVGLSPTLHARISLLQADVTGINDVFVQRAQTALALASEAEVYAALLGVLHDYRIDEPPRLFTEQEATGELDFACSSMVLSQLATPLTSYVQERFVARFPNSRRIETLEFQIALGQFCHRVQQAHVRSLLAAARCIALTTDIFDQHTALDPRGSVVRGAALPLIGAPNLSALLPRQELSTVFSAEWEWRHVVPTRVKPYGRTVQVQGVVAVHAAGPACKNRASDSGDIQFTSLTQKRGANCAPHQK